jgi:hypothetical protein
MNWLRIVATEDPKTTGAAGRKSLNSWLNLRLVAEAKVCGVAQDTVLQGDMADMAEPAGIVKGRWYTERKWSRDGIASRSGLPD